MTNRHGNINSDMVEEEEEDRKSCSIKFPTNQGRMIEEDSLIQKKSLGAHRQAETSYDIWMINKH